MSLVIRESVRGIVEYILQQGSLDDRHVSNIRAMEGTIAHSKVQSDNAKIYVQYEKEVKMDGRFEYGDITLLVEGRADGIIKENNEVIIEEIKSTYRDLLYIDEEYNLLEWTNLLLITSIFFIMSVSVFMPAHITGFFSIENKKLSSPKNTEFTLKTNDITITKGSE